MSNQSPPPFSKFLHPRHWSTWAGIGLLFVIVWLPFRLRMMAGSLLGWLTWLLARERRYITSINIRLCFPELTAEAQQDLIRQTFIENGIGLIETATGWMRSTAHFQHMLILTGTDHLDAALAQGRGVLLLGAHYTTLDFSANLLGVRYPFGVTYRAHRNPLFDAFMLRGRLQNCNGVFDRSDIRGAFRHLKQNKILWYAPDQDYGPDQAVFAPFFGRNAATITATTRFAAFNNSPTLMVRHHRLTDKKKYVIEFLPVLPPLPSGDLVADATHVNSMLEQCIRMAPAQYLWMHKRFKTQPYGKPQSPYILIKTKRRKINETLYQKLTTDAAALPNPQRLQLINGLQLWRYPGIARGLTARSHAMMKLDEYSKQLRAHGVVTVTIDSLFLIPFMRQSAATCHIPRGETLNGISRPSLPPQHAALFLARIHDTGFHFADMQGDNLLLYNNRLAVLDPLGLLRGKRVTTTQRLADLVCLMELLSYDNAIRAQCLKDYLHSSHTADRHSLQALASATTRVEADA